MKKVICILAFTILLFGTSAMAGLTPGTYDLPSLSDLNPTWSELWKGPVLGPGQVGNELQASGLSFSLSGALLNSVTPGGIGYFTTVYKGGTLTLNPASWGGPAIIQNIDFINSTQLLSADPTGEMLFGITGTGMFGSQSITLAAWYFGQPELIVDSNSVIGQKGVLYPDDSMKGQGGASITIGRPVPVPTALWLLGSGLLGLLGFRRKFSK